MDKVAAQEQIAFILNTGGNFYGGGGRPSDKWGR